MRMRPVLLLIGAVVGLSGCSKQIDADEKQKADQIIQASGYNVQLGLAYLKQGNRQRAKVKLMRALDEAPKSPEAYSGMAYYFEKTGEFSRARQYYQKAISLAKGRGPELNNFGAFLCRQKDYLTANRYFVRASQDINYINTAGAMENAGLCSLAIPDKGLAKFYFKKAVEQDPKRYQSVYQLAKMSLDEKDYRLSLSTLEQYENEANQLRAPLLWLGYQSASQLGLNKKAQRYAWVLKERFQKTPEYQKLIAENENHERAKSVPRIKA